VTEIKLKESDSFSWLSFQRVVELSGELQLKSEVIPSKVLEIFSVLPKELFNDGGYITDLKGAADELSAVEFNRDHPVHQGEAIFISGIYRERTDIKVPQERFHGTIRTNFHDFIVDRGQSQIRYKVAINHTSNIPATISPQYWPALITIVPDRLEIVLNAFLQRSLSSLVGFAPIPNCFVRVSLSENLLKFTARVERRGRNLFDPKDEWPLLDRILSVL
jgi:hypothetical protein